MANPLDNAGVTELVLKYQNSSIPAEREKFFNQITNLATPLIRATIARYRWDLSLGENPDDLLHEIVIKLPRVLSGWKSNNGSRFCSYLFSTIFNCYKGRYFKNQRRAKYHADWPTDADGENKDIADEHSEKLTGSLETMHERGRAFEHLIWAIPDELAAIVAPEHSGLVRYIAERYLQRADNNEALFFSQLRRDTLGLPAADALTLSELDSFIRMVIAGIRARLYQFRAEKQLPYTPGGISGQKHLLQCFHHKTWPMLLIFDLPETRRLVFCLAGLHDTVPPRAKWAKLESRRT